ncbi:MAG: protein-L-isoaspartate(D-aspartate) O-methyltransferase [Candidatus Omnitrophica bacterium]|nr:protein-L-isoaspartate(D-aspartate) O-methyltransferase [Candidatus Omnitrophota bacterium]
MRERMVSEQISSRGIVDKRILNIFRSVPRHEFIPKEQLLSAYSDCPLSIGYGQTISQPYMVAAMTKELQLKSEMTVLEVGTGSGYQTAILCALRARVYSIERIKQLADQAKAVLDSLDYRAEVKMADGTLGWEEYAPYDRIIITAAASSIPEPLVKQLKIGGRLVVPVGGQSRQELTVLDKISDKEVKTENIFSCVFVPLIGKYGYEN